MDKGNKRVLTCVQDREEHVRLLETKMTDLNVDLADLSKEQLLGRTSNMPNAS